MGRSCSKHQGFEIFPDHVGYRTAPEGKPADELMIELPLSQGKGKCIDDEDGQSCKRSGSGKFVSDCNLVVELPPDLADLHLTPDCEGEGDAKLVVQSQGTQTAAIGKMPKNKGAAWSYTFYDFEEEHNGLSEGENAVARWTPPPQPVSPADCSAPAPPDAIADSRGQHRRSSKAQKTRRTRPAEATLGLNDRDLLSAYINERLASMVTDGRTTKDVPTAGRGDDAANGVRVPRRSRRTSAVGGAAAATSGSVPARNETYPGACSPVATDEVDSLFVERGSDCAVLWPEENADVAGNHALRCPCARKRHRRCKNEMAFATCAGGHQQNDIAAHWMDLSGFPPRSRKMSGHNLGHNDSPDVAQCNNAWPSRGRKSRIDRSCLCDHGNGEPACSGHFASPPEIVMRHEHHHYHHYPKTRSSARRHTANVL